MTREITQEPSGPSEEESGPISALSTLGWDGSWKNQIISVAATYVRVSEVSTTEGTLPEGVIDNNDCSFTNDTGGTIKIRFTLITVMHNTSNNVMGLALGSDAGGSDAVVVANSAMTRPDDTTHAKNYTTDGTYEWANGKTIFPMVTNFSTTTTVQVGSSKQYFEIVG